MRDLAATRHWARARGVAPHQLALAEAQARAALHVPNRAARRAAARAQRRSPQPRRTVPVTEPAAPAPAPAAAAPATPATPATTATPPAPAAPAPRRVLARPAAPAAASPAPAAPAAETAAPVASTPEAPATPERRVLARPAAAPAAAPGPDARITALEGALGQLAESVVHTALPPAAREAFTATYASDPIGAARALAFIQAAGLAAPGAVPTGASTTPPDAPRPAAQAAQDGDVQAHARHEELRKTSPVLAAQYALAHHEAIARGRAKSAPRTS